MDPVQVCASSLQITNNATKSPVGWRTGESDFPQGLQSNAWAYSLETRENKV
ncbi:unnamed protein product, partial [Dovyalis caffra]